MSREQLFSQCYLRTLSLQQLFSQYYLRPLSKIIIIIIIIKLYFRPQPIDTHIQVQHGEIHKFESKVSVTRVKNRKYFWFDMYTFQIICTVTMSYRVTSCETGIAGEIDLVKKPDKVMTISHRVKWLLPRGPHISTPIGVRDGGSGGAVDPPIRADIWHLFGQKTTQLFD